VPHINLDILRNFEVLLPPLPTQRKIAAILSAYDDLIEVNTRRIALVEEMARGLYREWFVRFRFPGHEGVRMVESAVGLVPEGWEVKALGDISDMCRGRSYRTPDLADEGGLPFLNLKCIGRGGGFRYDGVKHYIGEYKPDQTARTGDIVVAVTDMTQERRLVAHAARVHVVDHDFGVMSMDLIRVEPKAKIPKGYLHGLLRFSAFSEEVCQHANGVNVLHLNPAQISAHKFALPPKPLRDRYAEFCASIYEQIDVLQLKNANLRRTRDLLLPRLVAGEVDLDHEVAKEREDHEARRTRSDSPDVG
jgi:type I restriction enzyme, S subunit